MSVKTNATLLALGLGLTACGDNIDKCDPTAPNTICTIAGSSLDEGYAGDGALATEATLYIPIDSTVAPNGDVWLIDFNNYVVRAIDSKTGIIETVIGNGHVGDSPASDGLPMVPALNAFNNHTTTLLFGPDGYLYLAAWHESRIKRVKVSDMSMEVYAGAGVRTYYTGDDGPAMSAAVDLPSSITFDPQGNLVLMDQGNQVVRMIDGDNVMHTIAGSCVIDGNEPCADGTLPAACPNSDKLACGDLATECANACTPSYGGDGGPALEARFSLPYGQAADPSGRVAYDHAGNLYVSDTGNNRIRKIDTAGRVSTFAGNGTSGFSGDGGPAAAAALNHPVDLAIADDDTVYFTDVFNNCVRKVDPAGTISTVVGQCSTNVANRGFEGDGGSPLEAKLNRPYGIDLHGQQLYVSDSYNNRLRVVNLP